VHDIAGIGNAAGNVVGLMPHPERSVDAALGSAEGLPFFQSLAALGAGARR
jgi:phosphoribosylformylglycinamidine synthase